MIIYLLETYSFPQKQMTILSKDEVYLTVTFSV